MWTSVCQSVSLNSAAQGSMFTISPLTTSNPVGPFIQPLTAITKNDPVRPVITIGMPVRKWTLPGSLSQP